MILIGTENVRGTQNVSQLQNANTMELLNAAAPHFTPADHNWHFGVVGHRTLSFTDRDKRMQSIACSYLNETSDKGGHSRSRAPFLKSNQRAWPLPNLIK